MEITELQKDLAATFRWTARLNMHEAVANHFSVSAPDSSEDFYVNGSGVHFSTIKSSDLVLIEQSKINELKDDLPADDLKRYEAQIQDLTDKFVQKLDELYKIKENELLEV